MCTEEQLSPRPDSVNSTLTAKSKLHSLFHWRKPSNVSLRPSTGYNDQPASGMLDPTVLVSRPRLSSRKSSGRSIHSTVSRPRSADNQLSHKHDRMINDPPPLAQVYGQSLLHAELETPTSFHEKHRSTGQITTDGHVRGFSGDKIEVKRSHKRTPSGESTCDTREKSFFLINGPYLLQYDKDSSGDAQPEKILILDQNSVAIACDAVPGRPWVLQISKPQLPAARSHGQTLRPSWSRMTLRQPEDRRTVNTLLLVFNDSDELYTWLFAVRKEIENLGGIEYRPDGEDDQTWRENLTRKFAAGSELHPKTPKRATEQSATSAHVSADSSRRRHGARSSSRMRTHSTQSSTSSKQTTTSLDRLRDSVASDGCTSTLATSCADGSASSNSPTIENFPGIKAMTSPKNGDLALRSYMRGNDASPRMSTSPKPSTNLLERRKLSVSSLTLSTSEEGKERGRKYLPDLPSTISASPIETPMSANRATKPGSPLIREVSATGEEWKPPRPLARNASTAGSSGSVPKAKYSLFPVCPPLESKPEMLASPPRLSKPLPIPAIIEPRSDSRMQIHIAEPDGRHQRSRSRTVVLELKQHRKSALLGAGEFMQPQRSPAVTDEMIMCNFGVAYDEPPASPMPEIKVPGLGDLAFDMDFLKMPYRPPSTQQAAAPASRRASSTRSASASRHERSTSMSKIPAGPPPAGPLPDVPLQQSRQSVGSKHSDKQRSKSRDRRSDRQDTTSVHVLNVELPTSASLYNMLGSGKTASKGEASQAKDDKEATSKVRARSRSRGRRRTGKT